MCCSSSSSCRKSVVFSKDLENEEISRYGRQLIISEIGVEGQRKLKRSKVLVVGTGGLGSPALAYLCSAGVGTIGLIDYDEVDKSNLQRFERNTRKQTRGGAIFLTFFFFQGKSFIQRKQWDNQRRVQLLPF